MNTMHQTDSSLRGLASAVSALFLCWMAASPVQAAIPLGDSNVQLGGFFSQGYVNSSGNNYPFTDKGGTVDFREMAFNASTPVGAHFRVGAQVFAERLGSYGEDKVILDWAVADYNFAQEFGLRAGRIKYPKGLYGEALDLDVTRPFVFLPMSIYMPILRDFNSAFNGAMAYGSLNGGKAGSVDYKLFYGDIPIGNDQGVADYYNNTGIFAAPGASSLGMDSTAGAQLFWNTPVAGLKVGYSYSIFSNLFAEGKFAAYPAGNVKLLTKSSVSHLVSAEYLVGPWTLAAEWQRRSGQAQVITPFGTILADATATAWYLSLARRFGSKLELGTYYSVQQDDHPAAGSPAAANHNRDWAVSVRYDLSEHVTLKLEGHTIDGYNGMFNTAKTPNPSLADHTEYFAAKVTLSF